MSRPRPTVAPANLNVLPREYARIEPKPKPMDRYSAMWATRVREGAVESEASFWKRKRSSSYVPRST
jgi:hypothetical protein